MNRSPADQLLGRSADRLIGSSADQLMEKSNLTQELISFSGFIQDLRNQPVDRWDTQEVGGATAAFSSLKIRWGLIENVKYLTKFVLNIPAFTLKNTNRKLYLRCKLFKWCVTMLRSLIEVSINYFYIFISSLCFVFRRFSSVRRDVFLNGVSPKAVSLALAC